MTSVLNESTLCLNKSWQPVSVRNVVKCLRKVVQGKAMIVDPYTYMMYDWDMWLDESELNPAPDGQMIRAMDIAIKIPDIVLLTTYNTIPKKGATFNRKNVYTRDNMTCQYCGTKLAREDCTWDHVVPRAQGGTSTWLNCVVACFPCNSKKRDRTPKEAGMKLLREPFQPRWVPSFTGHQLKDCWQGFMSDIYWETKLKEK